MKNTTLKIPRLWTRFLELEELPDVKKARRHVDIFDSNVYRDDHRVVSHKYEDGMEIEIALLSGSDNYWMEVRLIDDGVEILVSDPYEEIKEGPVNLEPYGKEYAATIEFIGS